MQNKADWKRKRPIVHYSVAQETKDLIDTLSNVTGKTKSGVVDKLIEYLATHHTLDEFIDYLR